MIKTIIGAGLKLITGDKDEPKSTKPKPTLSRFSKVKRLESKRIIEKIKTLKAISDSHSSNFPFDKAVRESYKPQIRALAKKLEK